MKSIQETLQDLVDSAQHLFDMRKAKGSTNVMKNAWNILAMSLFDAKKVLKEPIVGAASNSPGGAGVQLVCRLDEQQCQQECEHKADRSKCPLVDIRRPQWVKPNEQELYDVLITCAIRHKKRFTDIAGVHHETFNEHDAVHDMLKEIKAKVHAASNTPSVKDERRFKYLIERKDTHEWYCFNFFGYYGYGYSGESFGIHPDPKNDWTKDANDAYKFDKRETAEQFLSTTEFIHDLKNTECEVTEHDFLDYRPKCNCNKDECCSDCLPYSNKKSDIKDDGKDKRIEELERALKLARECLNSLGLPEHPQYEAVFSIVDEAIGGNGKCASELEKFVEEFINEIYRSHSSVLKNIDVSNECKKELLLIAGINPENYMGH